MINQDFGLENKEEKEDNNNIKFDDHLDQVNIPYCNTGNLTSMQNQHKIFDIIDNVKYYFQKNDYFLAKSYIEKSIPGFLECKTFIKFKLLKYQFYQLVLYNQTEAIKFYKVNLCEYLKQNYKNYQEKDCYFNKIILEPSLLMTMYVTERGHQNIDDFFQLLLREILNFLDGNCNLFYPSNEFLGFNENQFEYESDFEKEIVYQCNSSTKKGEYFRNIEQFKLFAEKDQSSECFKFLKNTIENLPPKFHYEEITKNKKQDDSVYLLNSNNKIHKDLNKNYLQIENEHKKILVFNVIKQEHQDNNIAKQKLPYSRRFNPRFTKRENIDKKIVRKFRKYLKEFYWKHPHIFDFSTNKDFWLKFVNEDLLPPSNFYFSGHNYNFKSFNTSYICWVFSQKNADYYFNVFIKEKGQILYKTILEKYWRKINELSENDKVEVTKQLETYIFNFSTIFNSNNFETSTFSIEYSEEQSESMPAVNPNNSGSYIDHMENNVQEEDDNIIYKKDKLCENNDSYYICNYYKFE